MMSSFLDSILCCCSRWKSIDENADEHASLLPQAEDGPSVFYDATTIDHQKAKERLHVIVKAKEGRMVRVLSRVPFNLRNEPSNGLANASSSRSNHSPSTNVSYANTRGPNHQYGIDNDSEQFSPKYRPSPSVSRSESTSSVQQASNSRFSTDDLSDPYAEHKLKVQLIPSAKNNQRVYSRRGRSKTKHGRFVEDADGTGNAPILAGIHSVDNGQEELDIPRDHAPFKGNEESRTATGSNNVDKLQVTPLSDEENAEIKAISKQLSPILKDDFADIGTLTRSWGD